MAVSDCRLSYVVLTYAYVKRMHKHLSRKSVKDFIRDLRKRVGLNQTNFAQMLGIAYPTLQGYEAGRNVPAPVVERLAQIAVKYGHADLAAAFGVEFDVKHILKPGELLISASPARSAGPYNPTNKELHDALELILESGSQEVKGQVVPNLLFFRDYVSRMKGQEPPAKRGSKPRREVG